MKIGELARQTGMAASAIRFYEARGLLNKVQRGANGYRDYPPETVPLLTIISQAQQAGFSLDEIKQLVPADISTWQHAPLLAALKAKVSDIEALEARLAHSKQQLQTLIRLVESKPDEMPCEENAARVLASMGIPSHKHVAKAATTAKSASRHKR
ncbi:MerR family transcriptional regulator [Aeromonas veronii]|uniref:MerR family transcriptional regulator n=1 Tax=Aeromonas veronii TaxID=654 RepID=UPI001A8F78F2|nr:MerR family transcriptional regulator [Aeromonas veronii]MCX9112310.1 MerR family transcriptional regulator [Aeromonas veronii]QSR46924.1 MerR family transcriptional regulator [Aeromonas veronii]